MRNLARLIAIGRVVIGVAMIVAPSRAARLWLGDAAERPGTQVALRAFGGRDVALGVGALLAERRGRSIRGWVEAGVLSDLVDAGATAVAWRHLPETGRVLALATASGATVAGVLIAQSDATEPAA